MITNSQQALMQLPKYNKLFIKCGDIVLIERWTNQNEVVDYMKPIICIWPNNENVDICEDSTSKYGFFIELHTLSCYYYDDIISRAKLSYIFISPGTSSIKLVNLQQYTYFSESLKKSKILYNKKTKEIFSDNTLIKTLKDKYENNR